MDPALKQRMLGAAVLIVLAIIFVPMLLDGPPHPETGTVDLTLPKSPDRDFETRVVPLDPQSTSPAAAADDPNHIETVDTASAPRVDALAGAEPPPAPAAAAPPPATPVPAPATPTPAIAPPTATPRGRWVVSFGSYAKAENAKALVATLGKAKIAAYTDAVDVNGAPGLRVRAGPFVDRPEAEKIRLLAKQVSPDAPATVVEVDAPAPAATAATPAPRGATGWIVQVAAVGSEKEAHAKRDELRGKGFTSFVETLRTSHGLVYRVRVGPESRRENADKLLESLRTQGFEGYVAAHP